LLAAPVEVRPPGLASLGLRKPGSRELAFEELVRRELMLRSVVLRELGWAARAFSPLSKGKLFQLRFRR
jgi:hypothetical protein